jgi:hypothetical protein
MFIQSVNIGLPQTRSRNDNTVLTGGDKEPVVDLIARLVELPEFGDSGRAIFAQRLAQALGQTS